ncbi:MAG: hypothetical protein GX094_00270 [Clostridiales bacterium]|jgi:hypothetical protein|nr:hypothetical protein [Clostridiales bacterium]
MASYREAVHGCLEIIRMAVHISITGTGCCLFGDRDMPRFNEARLRETREKVVDDV